MKFPALLLIAAMIGCASGVPAQGWYINGSSANQIACFETTRGLSTWAHCSEWTGESKTTCQAEALVTYQGVLVSEKTLVGLWVHTPRGFSSVRMDNGKDLFCPTVQVRRNY